MQEASAFYRSISGKTDEEHQQKEVILCLDPDNTVLKHLAELFTANGFRVLTANDLGKALELALRERPAVVFTEIRFPDVDATSILQSFRRLDKDVVTIIYTEQEERRVSRDRRLDHVFEFVVKPASASKLIGHTKRALAFRREKMLLKRFVEESRERIKQQLEWLLWVEQQHVEDRKKFSKSIVDSIKHSITQGNGVGSLITYIEMLQIDKKPHTEEGKYIVSAAMIDGLMESSGTVRNWLDDMDGVARNLAKKYESEIMSSRQIDTVVKEVISSLDQFRTIKNHTITFDDIDFNKPIVTNSLVLQRATRELLTNAFKFSPENSTIKVGYNRTSNSLSILISNEISRLSGGIVGIPSDLENKIFEPFFRLNNVMDDRFNNEMYGMGTGLTIIQHAINQVSGRIYIYESHDPDANDKKTITSEMIFPIHIVPEE